MRIKTDIKKERSRIDSILSNVKTGKKHDGVRLWIDVSIMSLILLIVVQTGCSSVDKRKYIIAGPVVGEKVHMFEDYWSDYGIFKPMDSDKKMRRGKAGVIRFFKEGNYVRSVRVDGSLVVYVFEGTKEGVELSQPHAKLLLSPDQLEKQRKYDKKVGHAYHIWLDLGEVDLPEADISIMSVFTDANSGEQTTSKLIHTTVPGKPKKETAIKKKVKKREIDEKELDQIVQERMKEEKLKEALKSQIASSDRTITTIDLENGSQTLYSMKNGSGIPNTNTAPPNDYSRFSALKNNTDITIQGTSPSMKKKYTLDDIRHLAFNPTQPGNTGGAAPQTIPLQNLHPSQNRNNQKPDLPTYPKALTQDPIDEIVPEIPSSTPDKKVFTGSGGNHKNGIIRR